MPSYAVPQTNQTKTKQTNKQTKNRYDITFLSAIRVSVSSLISRRSNNANSWLVCYSLLTFNNTNNNNNDNNKNNINNNNNNNNNNNPNNNNPNNNNNNNNNKMHL